MVKVKICGIRRMEDVEYVNACKPDYIGFVFAESKRRISIEEACKLAGKLDSGIKRVGVFVNENIESVMKTAGQCALEAVQLHGDEGPEYINELKNLIKSNPEFRLEVWKAVRVKDMNSLELMKRFKADAFILDTFTEGVYGGAGKVFDWNLAAKAGEYGRIFLAGGLTPDNIEQAIQTVKPYGVDTSSGVETEGIKDLHKVRNFVLKSKIL